MRKVFILVLVCTTVLGTMALFPGTSVARSARHHQHHNHHVRALTLVTGNVTYKGSAVDGASVTVVCGSFTAYAKTHGGGGYAVQFPHSKTPPGTAVSVTAKKGSLTGSNTGTVGYVSAVVNIAVVNVTLVPEFGAIAGIGALLIGGGAFFIIRRRRLAFD